jgi:hypothetical protein
MEAETVTTDVLSGEELTHRWAIEPNLGVVEIQFGAIEPQPEAMEPQPGGVEEHFR